MNFAIGQICQMDTLVRSSTRRIDGAATRAQLLDAAGQVFAEKGFDRATGKEIAERAGSNSAAINYYFGSIEGLYAEVLVAAHRSLATYEEIAAIAHGTFPPVEKLRRLMVMAVAALQQPPSRGWALRVLSRELLAPTPSRRVLEDRELLPKKQLVTAIVAEVVGLPESDPVVARCCLSILAPVTLLLVSDAEGTARTFPEFADGLDCEALASHLHEFALGGIEAVTRMRIPR
jgi:TetR/AcrR family transcriptional regulator, regulator of cefoperazone and chloramphenicol sensitivity